MAGMSSVNEGVLHMLANVLHALDGGHKVSIAADEDGRVIGVADLCSASRHPPDEQRRYSSRS